MKVTVCDLCNRLIINEEELLMVKVYNDSFYESGWEKLDVCVDCKRAILELSYKKRKERENK